MAVQMEYEKDVKVAALDGKNRRDRLWLHKVMPTLKTCVTQVMM